MGGVGLFALPLFVITLKDLKESGVLDLSVFIAAQDEEKKLS